MLCTPVMPISFSCVHSQMWTKWPRKQPLQREKEKKKDELLQKTQHANKIIIQRSNYELITGVVIIELCKNGNWAWNCGNFFMMVQFSQSLQLFKKVNFKL